MYHTRSIRCIPSNLTIYYLIDQMSLPKVIEELKVWSCVRETVSDPMMTCNVIHTHTPTAHTTHREKRLRAEAAAIVRWRHHDCRPTHRQSGPVGIEVVHAVHEPILDIRVIELASERPEGTLENRPTGGTRVSHQKIIGPNA